MRVCVKYWGDEGRRGACGVVVAVVVVVGVEDGGGKERGIRRRVVLGGSPHSLTTPVGRLVGQKPLFFLPNLSSPDQSDQSDQSDHPTDQSPLNPASLTLFPFPLPSRPPPPRPSARPLAQA